MSVTDWVPIASVAASAAVGLGVPYIVTRHERRDLRAEVLRRVGDVERTRWAPQEWSEFRQSIYALRGAALVAGADRDVVDRYIFLVHVARRSSDDSWERDPDPDSGGGGIPGQLGSLTSDAASLLAEHLWHPLRNQRRVKRGLAKSREEEADFRAQDEDLEPFFAAIDWSPPRF